MKQRGGTAVRIAVLFTTLFAALTLAAQEVVLDYALEILQSGTPFRGGEVGFALVVTANWSTVDPEPFVVELTVPEGLTPGAQCHGFDGEMRFDPATRVLTWTHRLDGTAFSSCPVWFRVDSSVTPGTTFSLTAKLTRRTPDPNPANDSAEITSTVLAAADLEVKTSADRQRVKPGETIAYTLEVRNLGPQTAHDIFVTDYLSPLVSFVSFEQTSGPPASIEGPPSTGERRSADAHLPMLPAGSTATFRLVVRANSSFEAGDIRNRFTARSATSVDVAERNNDFEEVVFAGPDADLSMESRLLEASPTRSTLLLRIANAGPEGVNGATLQGVLATGAARYDFVQRTRFASVTPSQGTCTTALRPSYGGHPPPPASWTMDCELGMLAPGAVATVTVVIERSPDAGPFRLSAAVGPSQNDPQRENNRVVVTSNGPRRRAVRR